MDIIAITTMLKHWLQAASEILLPRVCVVCGERLLLSERTICLHCLADMPLTHFWQQSHNPMSDRFNSVIQHGLEKAWDKEAKEDMLSGPDLHFWAREHYAYAAALFFYSHDADFRQILYKLKYEGRTDIGKYFGHILGSRLSSSSVFKDVDCVVPVPLHWTRKWKRGYNQAEVIAQEVAMVLGVPLRCSLLIRSRKTRTQTKLDIKGKASNVNGAFKVCHSSGLPNNIKHILLVDDTFTTGSTLHACFVALREVFPPSVRISIATLAFVGGP